MPSSDPDSVSDADLESGRLVKVFSTMSLPEAELAKGLLESEGIPVLLKGEGEGVYRAGAVYLWVLEEDEETSKALLKDAASGELATEETDAE